MPDATLEQSRCSVYYGSASILTAIQSSPSALMAPAFMVQKHCAARLDAYVPACGGSSGRASFHASYAWLQHAENMQKYTSEMLGQPFILVAGMAHQ